MLTKIKDYINDNEFRLTMYINKIHVINYSKIISLEDNRISFLTNNNRIIIKGENLTLNKLLEDEVLVSGKILNIEVNWNE